MSTARQAKRCPQCGTMASADTALCGVCGHLFRSDHGAAPEAFNPDRTQMLTLPPTLLFPRSAQPMRQAEPPQFIEPHPPDRRAVLPLVTVLSTIALLLTTFIWFFAH